MCACACPSVILVLASTFPPDAVFLFLNADVYPIARTREGMTPRSFSRTSYTHGMAASEVSIQPDAAEAGRQGATTATSPLRPNSVASRLLAGTGIPPQLKQQQAVLAMQQKTPSGRFSNLPAPRSNPVPAAVTAAAPNQSSPAAQVAIQATEPSASPANTVAANDAQASATTSPLPFKSEPSESNANTMSTSVPYSALPDGLERIASELPSFTSELPSFTLTKDITDVLDSDSDTGMSDMEDNEEDWDGAINKLRAEEASFIRHAKIPSSQPSPTLQQQQPQQQVQLRPLSGQQSPASPGSPAAHPMLQFESSPVGTSIAHNLNHQLGISLTGILSGGLQGIPSPTGSTASRRVSYAGSSSVNPSRRVSATGGNERAAPGLLFSLTQQLDDPQQTSAYVAMSVRNASKNLQKEIIPSYARHTRASSSGDVDINRAVSGKFVSPLKGLTQSRLSLGGYELDQHMSQKVTDRPPRTTVSGTRFVDAPTSPKLTPTPLSKPMAGMPPPIPKHPLARKTTASSSGAQL